MDINMFLVFPGILITIGVVLLLLSIIIVIIAFKTAKTPEKANESLLNANNVIEENNNIKETPYEIAQEPLQNDYNYNNYDIYDNEMINNNIDNQISDVYKDSSDLEATKVFTMPKNNQYIYDDQSNYNVYNNYDYYDNIEKNNNNLNKERDKYLEQVQQEEEEEIELL